MDAEKRCEVDWNAMEKDQAINRTEFLYIFDIQYRHGGHFKNALYKAIACADESNTARLAKGFPGEVAAYRAWTRGDLAQRARKYGVD